MLLSDLAEELFQLETIHAYFLQMSTLTLKLYMYLGPRHAESAETAPGPQH